MTGLSSAFSGALWKQLRNRPHVRFHSFSGIFTFLTEVSESLTRWAEVVLKQAGRGTEIPLRPGLPYR